jgi:hypothetical protein
MQSRHPAVFAAVIVAVVIGTVAALSDPSIATEPPIEEVGIVFHNITWTYDPAATDASFDKNTLLRQAEQCTRLASRNDAEACLRRNGWKPKK